MAASRVPFEKGVTVFRAGAAPRHNHFVEEGAIRLVRHGREGEEVVLHQARPGEFLAEASSEGMDRTASWKWQGLRIRLAGQDRVV